MFFFVNSDSIIHCCFWPCHLTLFEANHKLRLLQPQYLVFGKKGVTSNIQRQKFLHPSCCQLGWSRVFAVLKKTIKRRNANAPHFHLFASLRDCTTFQPRSLFSNVKVGNTTSDRKTFPISALGWESLAQILFQRGDGLTRDMTSDVDERYDKWWPNTADDICAIVRFSISGRVSFRPDSSFQRHQSDCWVHWCLCTEFMMEPTVVFDTKLWLKEWPSAIGRVPR